MSIENFARNNPNPFEKLSREEIYQKTAAEWSVARENFYAKLNACNDPKSLMDFIKNGAGVEQVVDGNESRQVFSFETSVSTEAFSDRHGHVHHEGPRISFVKVDFLVSHIKDAIRNAQDQNMSSLRMASETILTYIDETFVDSHEEGYSNTIDPAYKEWLFNFIDKNLEAKVEITDEDRSRTVNEEEARARAESRGMKELLKELSETIT